MFIFVSPHKLSIKKYYLLILKIKKLRHRKTKQLISCHSAKKCYSWDLNPGSLRSVPCDFFPNILRVNSYQLSLPAHITDGDIKSRSKVMGVPTVTQGLGELGFSSHSCLMPPESGTTGTHPEDPSATVSVPSLGLPKPLSLAVPWTKRGLKSRGLTGPSSSIGKASVWALPHSATGPRLAILSRHLPSPTSLKFSLPPPCPPRALPMPAKGGGWTHPQALATPGLRSQKAPPPLALTPTPFTCSVHSWTIRSSLAGPSEPMTVPGNKQEFH